MDFGNITTNIIKRGLVFNMDAANRASTIPSTNTTKAFNTINLSQSGTFSADAIYDSSTISPSLAFDGTGDNIDFGDIGFYSPQISISCWIYPSNNGRFIKYGDSGSNPALWCLVHNSTDLRIYVRNVYRVFSSCITLNQWHYVTITRIDYNNGKVYVNGVSQGDLIGTVADLSQTGDLEIGDSLLGNAANYQIYNRALSAKEVLHNFNALKDRMGYVAPDPLILDTYTGAAAAYSLRRLSLNYTGNAIRVRRSSDNSEQDIGFTNNELDTVSLLSFVGSNDGYVTTWYDQGGNEHNITNSTAGKQPLIVSAGAVRTTDSKPSIYFNSSRRDLLGGSRINGLHDGTKSFTISLVKSNRNTTGRQTIMRTSHVFSSNKGYNLHMKTNPGYVESRVVNGSTTVSLNQTSNDYPHNNRYLITDTLDVNNATLANRSTLNINNSSDIKNNTSNGSATTADSSTGFTIGGNVSDSFFRGDMQEIIVYTSDQSSNKAGITENINNHYLVY